MAKRPASKTLSEPQRRRQTELRRLEEQGDVELSERDADEPEHAVRLKSSADPVVAKLLDIDRQLVEVLASRELSHHFRAAVEVAQFALTKAALLKGALAVGGHDPGGDHARSIALARVALTGREPGLEGLRAQVHDMLLRYARMADFSKLNAAQQRAIAELLAAALPAHAGTIRPVDATVVAAALRHIASPDGRPKGSRTHAPPTVSAAREKWQALHTLFGKLGIIGSTPEALEKEVPATKKAATMPRKLRQT